MCIEKIGWCKKVLRVLICDDDASIVKNMRAIVENYFIEHKIEYLIDEAYDSKSVISQNNVYNIAAVDIEMPDYNGFSVADHLKNINSDIIIFVITAYSNYLDDAMDARAFRFFTKPLDKERILRGLESAVRFYRNNTSIAMIYGSTAQRVYTNDILYISINSRKTVVVTKQGEIRSGNTMNEWKRLLNMDIFAQPHYSYLVNMQNIDRIDKDMIYMKNSKNETIMIKIAQRKSKEFRDKFFSFLSDSVNNI